MFLKRYATKYNKPIEGFDQAAVREMDEYPWAGNIRELQHTVEKSRHHERRKADHPRHTAAAAGSGRSAGPRHSRRSKRWSAA